MEKVKFCKEINHTHTTKHCLCYQLHIWWWVTKLYKILQLQQKQMVVFHRAMLRFQLLSDSMV